jgi:uncharacterized short protein YbdD (DUF466 family)
MNSKRPDLNKRISVKDFKDFYWLKSELVNFCREVGVGSSGGKIEIANRISEYLETGKHKTNCAHTLRSRSMSIIKKPKLPKATQPITEEVVIGIEYRTYKEKKDFLKSVIGNQFHFTIHLLDYFKKNAGKKTYNDLINEWYKEQEIKKDPNFIKEIAPQFEYNTYIRDFMKDNPNKTRKDAIKFWKIKKDKRGNNKYSKNDLI